MGKRSFIEMRIKCCVVVFLLRGWHVPAPDKRPQNDIVALFVSIGGQRKRAHFVQPHMDKGPPDLSSRNTVCDFTPKTCRLSGWRAKDSQLGRARQVAESRRLGQDGWRGHKIERQSPPPRPTPTRLPRPLPSHSQRQPNTLPNASF